MRSHLISLLFLAAAALPACRSNTPPDDTEILKNLITSYFEAIGAKDFEKLKALTTDDFVLYEDGLVWNNDSVFNNIRRHIPFTVKYKLDSFNVFVDTRSADMRYSNHADFVFHDTDKLSLDWIESATFRKMPSGWKMNFLHLTVKTVDSGQNIRYDTIRYAKEHYNNRLNEFKSQPVIKRRTIFLGNSLTEYGDWQSLLGDSTIINRGIAGDNTFGVLDRLEDIITRQPDKLFVEIGINDISQNIPDNIIVKNILTLVAQVQTRSPETRIYVHSILPTNDRVKNEYPEAYNKNAQIELVNRQLLNSAKERNFTYIDLNTKVSNHNGKLDGKYAAPDGLHLNKAGYATWVRLLKEKKML